MHAVVVIVHWYVVFALALQAREAMFGSIGAAEAAAASNAVLCARDFMTVSLSNNTLTVL